MRFQTKLLVSYSLIIVLLTIGLGLGFYTYSAGVFERNARSNLLTLSDRMAQQLDNLIKPMDFITAYLLSNVDFMSSMASLAYLDRGEESNLIYVNEGWNFIRKTLLSYSISRNFYAVNIFNRSGDFLSTNLVDFASTTDPRPRFATVPWIVRADAESGRIVLVPPYKDPWAPHSDRAATVYGIARTVWGQRGPMGYIEVQNVVADLDLQFKVPKVDQIFVFAFLSDGSLFYQSPSTRVQPARGRVTEKDELSYFAGLALKESGPVFAARDPVTGREEIVAFARAVYTGLSVLLVQDKVTLLRPLVFTRNIAIVVGILSFLASLLYNYFFSWQLAKPIHRLKTQMDGTELGNLPDAIALEDSNDEIEALNAAFLRLRSRLALSLRREIEAQSLQERARYESLQAQVSPHFLYNILTVLANKGLEVGSDEIREICENIADLLRYSTSTVARSTSLEEELAHVRSYLFLMRKRLEQRLKFNIDVDPAILTERMPKIVLQQLAENSIRHGFDGSRRILRISVRGGLFGDRWKIELADNGRGFEPAVLGELQLKISRLASEAPLAETEGLAIGGMGLVNLYSRLRIFYRRDFDFEIGQEKGGGALVAMGARRGSVGVD